MTKLKKFLLPWANKKTWYVTAAICFISTKMEVDEMLGFPVTRVNDVNVLGSFVLCEIMPMLMYVTIS